MLEALISIVLRMLYAPPKVIAPKLSTKALPFGAFMVKLVTPSSSLLELSTPMLPAEAVRLAVVTVRRVADPS